jgi:hypothetical protein
MIGAMKHLNIYREEEGEARRLAEAVECLLAKWAKFIGELEAERERLKK